ncbi:MAG TPA: hypothetical protein VF763_01345 [Candidatus Limnocylindrales bacterium]
MTEMTHRQHTGHDDHRHGPGCGHPSMAHEDHQDYVHDGHRHGQHGDHWDEHDVAMGGRADVAMGVQGGGLRTAATSQPDGPGDMPTGPDDLGGS